MVLRLRPERLLKPSPRTRTAAPRAASGRHRRARVYAATLEPKSEGDGTGDQAVVVGSASRFPIYTMPPARGVVPGFFSSTDSLMEIE